MVQVAPVQAVGTGGLHNGFGYEREGFFNAFYFVFRQAGVFVNFIFPEFGGVGGKAAFFAVTGIAIGGAVAVKRGQRFFF